MNQGKTVFIPQCETGLGQRGRGELAAELLPAQCWLSGTFYYYPYLNLNKTCTESGPCLLCTTWGPLGGGRLPFEC